MENAKPQDIDGLPIELYKSQYDLIKNDPLQLYNSIPLWNENILTPKNDKKELLKNWRPISLLCVDYKIVTKIISSRLKTTLDQVISKGQTCGIPNRSIFCNLFTTRELIHHSKIKNINSYIVSVNQEKAFDKVGREFLFRIVEKLGYSKIFINFIKKIYQNIKPIISNNGFLSNPFPLSRGVRQGSPLSLLLYIINAEVINLNIKANKRVVGYPIPNQNNN